MSKKWIKSTPECPRENSLIRRLRLPFWSPSSLVPRHPVLPPHWTAEGVRVSQRSLAPCPCAVTVRGGLLPILPPENSPFETLESHQSHDLPPPTSSASANPPRPTGPGGLSVVTETSLVSAITAATGHTWLWSAFNVARAAEKPNF